MWDKISKHVCWLLLLASQQSLYADDWQGNKQPFANSSQSMQGVPTDKKNLPNLPNLAAQTASSDDQLARQVYAYTQNNNPAMLQQLLNQYVVTTNPDILLLLYAEGKLAMMTGDFKRAEDYFARLNQMQKNFLPAQLELARSQYVRYKNKESAKIFNAIQKQIAHLPQKYLLQPSIQEFKQAIHARDAWQGSVNIGWQYNNNINQSSRQTDYFYQQLNPTQKVLITRSAPKADGATGLNYQLSANKHFSVVGHHGMVLNIGSHGILYQPPMRQYNQSNWLVGLGYQWRDAFDEFNFLINNQLLQIEDQNFYQLLEWNLNYRHYWQQSLISLSFSRQRKRHNEDTYQQNDAYMNQTALDYYYQINSWLFYSHWYYQQHHKKQAYFNYWQLGTNLALQKTFNNGNSISFFANYSQSHYARFNALLSAKRHEQLSAFGLKLQAGNWFKWPLQPSLQYSYQRNSSNVDWLYSYRQNILSAQVEYRF